jgi:hypothetical protein
MSFNQFLSQNINFFSKFMKNFKNIVLSSLEMKERNIRSENIVIHKLRQQFYLQNTRKY